MRTGGRGRRDEGRGEGLRDEGRKLKGERKRGEFTAKACQAAGMERRERRACQAEGMERGGRGDRLG